MPRTAALRARDQEPAGERFLEEALAGLRAPDKWLPCKYLYDERGSELFERICELPEYYPTRSELEIMRAHAGEMAEALGPGVLLIEYGSGSSLKTRLLLDVLEGPSGYLPVDISREQLLKSSAALAADYPKLEVLPICADFSAPFALPGTQRRAKRRVIYFPGSTIGNFSAEHATRLLAEAAALCAPDGAMLIGVDLRKDRETLERAYDDSEGITAAFNRNLLQRMNRELGADFDLGRFQHRALWAEAQGRVEMHLVSAVEQVAQIAGERIHFRAGESICTEHSHKYTLKSFAGLARSAGLCVTRVWSDPRQRFSVQLIERGG